MEFRTLRADEILIRVGQTFTSKTEKDKNGKPKVIAFTLLLYKNARCDMNILDEAVGAVNWQRKHYILGDTMYCSVGIYDKEINQWIWKDDCGSAGQFEQEKSRSSGSFKRACSNWGIGRELYTAPIIKLKGDDKNYLKYKVFNVEYNNFHQITKLRICALTKDFEWKEVFMLDKGKTITHKKEYSIKATEEEKEAALNYATKKGTLLKNLEEEDLKSIVNSSTRSPQEKYNARIVLSLHENNEFDKFIEQEMGFDDESEVDEVKLPWED